MTFLLFFILILLTRTAQGSDYSLLAGPGKERGVEHIALDREANIPVGVNSICFIEADLGGCAQVGWALAGYKPRAGAVDGFAVNIKPGAHIEQQVARAVRDCSIGPGPDIEQQLAVLADSVNQVVNQPVGSFERKVVGIAPRAAVIYGRVGNPLVVCNLRLLAEFQVSNT